MSQDLSLTIAQTMAAVSIVLLVGVSIAPVLARTRNPPVIAEILAGIALGPSLLGLLPGGLPDRLFPASVRTDLAAIAQVGILLFMFLVGWQAGAEEQRSGGRLVLAVSLSSAIVPFLGGAALAMWLYGTHDSVGGHHVNRAAFVLFIGTATAITAFPVLARIIAERGLQNTAVGKLALSAAATGDLLAWCMLAVISTLAATHRPAGLITLATGLLVTATALVLLVRPLLRHLIARAVRTGRTTPLLPLITSGVLAAGWAAHAASLDMILGAFAFGLAMPRESYAALETAVAKPMRQAAAPLLPVFFVGAGLSVDVTSMGAAGLLELSAIVAVACAGKLGAALVTARLARLSWHESWVLALLMNTRGLTEIVILNAGVQMGVLDQRLYTAMVLMAIVTTVMAGPLLPQPDRLLSARAY